jgi:hypothetical protein
MCNNVQHNQIAESTLWSLEGPISSFLNTDLRLCNLLNEKLYVSGNVPFHEASYPSFSFYT